MFDFVDTISLPQDISKQAFSDARKKLHPQHLLN